MPVITLEAGDMSKEQKKTLIEGFTKVASETLNIAAEAFVVILKQNAADNIGSGGKMLSQIFAERQG
jgi:4-oxalocrotonate tautomerase